MEPSTEHLQLLKSSFGYDNFRPKQWDVIHSIIVKRQDNCVVMGAGYGKSLLYQYPSVYLKGLTIVISPLISLMTDQVRFLMQRGIPSCFLGSAQSEHLTPAIQSGQYRIVYITPEYAMGEKGQELLHEVSHMMNLIAVDEAHYLSSWGYSFRGAYHKLKKLRNDPLLAGVPILACSSIATQRVRQDIVTALQLQNANIWCTGFDRPNLSYHVKMKSASVWNDLNEQLHEYANSCVIIYCLTRNQVVDVTNLLRCYNIPCEPYHSGIPLQMREIIQENFIKNRIKIVVATIAFGMGINKPDIRLIVHYGAPMEFESYYLGVGQAGRDGNRSKCVLFWDERDFEMHSFIRSCGLAEYQAQSKSKQEQQEAQSTFMRRYLQTDDCRRKFILRYFEDLDPLCCDNCESRIQKPSISDQPLDDENLSDDEIYTDDEPETDGNQIE